MSKKTVIVGASPNPARYAFLAAENLHRKGHDFVPLGIKKADVLGKPIQQIFDKPAIKDVDTVTLYIGPHRQPEWYQYLINLNPKRIIFNPGTENPQFMKMAEDKGIEVVEGCTLVMLRTGQY